MKLNPSPTRLFSLGMVTAAVSPGAAITQDQTDATLGLFLIASIAWAPSLREYMEVARPEAKEFLLGGETSDVLRDCIKALREGAAPAAREKGIDLKKLSNLQIARLIYTGKIE